MEWNALPARTLDQHELRQLVEELAVEPELWQQHVVFAAGDRHYESLYRDEHVDVWVLCWVTDNDTGWHDHDSSSGAVRVVRGVIAESNPRFSGEHLVSEMPEGTTFSFGPDHIHRLSTVHDGSVTIHAYSPPLWRLGQYAITEGGLLRRTAVSYAEELRPLELSAG
jgi:Cysteine dioxygenase type I